MIKRALAFLLAVFIIIPSFSIGAVGEYGYEPDVFLYAEASEIFDNNTVDISVYADCRSEITVVGMQLSLSYDYPNISYVEDSAVFGESFRSSQVGIGDGSLKYIWDSVTGADLSGGNILIFKATFALADDIEDGDYSFGLEEVKLYDESFFDIYNETEGCSVWVGSFFEGPYGIEVEPYWTYGKQVDEWCSTDESVATVDSNGTVNLISPGTAVIIAYGFEEGVIAKCKVTVTYRHIVFVNVNKQPIKTDYVVGESIDLTGLVLRVDYDNYDVEYIDSGFVCKQGVDYDFSTPGEKSVKVHYGNYGINIKVTVHAGISSSVYSQEDGYITGVPPLTDLSDFFKNLQVDAGDIKVYSGEEEIKSGFAATGMTVRLYLSEKVVQTFKIAVAGDVNCDGECNIFDLIRIKKAASGMTELDGAQLKAAGCSDSYPNASDIVRVQRQIING